MIIDHTEDDTALLWIEPSNSPSQEPIIDELTRKMAAALRQAEECDWTRGVHRCTGGDETCGCNSASCSFRLPGGLVTHSLAVHYLAHHRDEVPAEELAKVAGLQVEGVDPTSQELSPKGWF